VEIKQKGARTMKQDVWNAICTVCLKKKISEISHEMQTKISRDKRTAQNYAQQIKAQEQRAEEWAEKLYEAACENRDKLNTISPCEFNALVYSNLILPHFASRKSAVSADLQHQDQMLRQPNKSTSAACAFSRSMDKLISNWHKRLLGVETDI
jgi:hypothetical protein